MGRREGSPGSETPNPLNDLYSLPIGFGKSRLWGEEAASTGVFFWWKFSLRNHHDSATAPPRGTTPSLPHLWGWEKDKRTSQSA